MKANLTAAAAAAGRDQDADESRASSFFLKELNGFEGIDIPVKLPPVYFQEQLDEVRDKMSKAAKRELNALHGIVTHERRDKYGLAQSSWWKEDASGRIQITLRDGARPHGAVFAPVDHRASVDPLGRAAFPGALQIDRGPSDFSVGRRG